MPLAPLPALPPDCLQLDYIRAAFQRPVAWSVEPRVERTFETAAACQAPARHAAVLMPLVERPQGVQLLFTRRAAHLQHHAGQVSFPGGCIEAFDRDAVAAAIRETQEEIGVGGEHVRIFGEQPALLTTTRFLMTPVVGTLLPGFHVTPDDGEVAEVFEVPLSVLMDPAHYRLHCHLSPGGVRRYYFSVEWHTYFIWGATAALLRNFYRFLAASAGLPVTGSSLPPPVPHDQPKA